MRVCSVSVDLDEVNHYSAIHGIDATTSSHAVYDIALPRMRKWASELRLTLTLFVDAADTRSYEKATALLGMKLRGKRSRSVLDSPKVLRAPSCPYRIGEPYWVPGNGLLELPIQVAGPLRMPFIGTTLALLGASAARLLTRTVLGQPLVNLELHGIDFLDAQDVPGELGRVQPDLRVPWARKREALGAVLELLRGSGYAFVRLDEAARAFS